MMYLLKRGAALSRQGWRDDFNRPDENPIQPPWRQWGDSTSARILGNKLRMDSNGFFNWAVGGWGAEYQPLTPHWGYEWQMDFLGSGTPGSFSAYLDKNWTRGQNQGISQYSTYLSWTYESTTDANNVTTESWYLGVYHKNKDAFLSARKDIYSMTQAQFYAPHTWRIDVFYDRAILVRMDGNPVLLYSIDDSNYYFSADRRGLNFRSNAWSTEIDWFDVVDIRAMPFTRTDIFSDNFNRSNGSPGNGWTVLGSNAGINSNSYAMNGGLQSDGGRAIIRNTGVTNGRVAVRGIPGGAAGPSAHEQGLVLCSNSTGTQGLISRSTSSNAKILRFSSALTGNPPSYTTLGTFKDAIGGISSGNVLDFQVYDGDGYIWRGTELLAFAPNVHAVVPASNSYAGAQVSRSAFINSGAWNDVMLSSL